MTNAIKYVLCLLVAVGCGDVVTDPGPDDPCPEGAVCECTAATEVDDCGAHQFCEESGENRQCKCVALYEDSGSGCEFVGGPADPGFQDPAAWSVTGNGIQVVSGAPGIEQPGELVIDRFGTCEFSFATQTVTMPPYNRADPLKVTIGYHVNDPFNFNQPPFFGPELAGRLAIQVTVGGQFHEFELLKNQPKKHSFCIGEAGFDGPVEIKLGTVTPAPNCVEPPVASPATIRLDELKIEVAEPGECPAQPGVLNGNFQLATGWFFPATQSGEGQLIADIGENGSFAARLTQPNKCSQVTAQGTISIPTALEHPALDVYWNGTSNTRLAVRLGGRGIGTLNANGEIKHSRLCLPKWAVGNVSSLEFFAQRASDNGCGTALNRTFILDNMTVVDEPNCGTLADIVDPGFEFITDAEGPMPGWSLTNDYVNDVESGRAFIVNQAAQANSGAGVLRTSALNPCGLNDVDGPGAEIAFVAPAPAGTAGPAVKFMAKAANNPNTETRALFTPDNGNRVTIPETNAFVPQTLCVPPGMAGRLVTVRLQTVALGGGCGTNFSEEFGFFDDVEVTTDAACPAL